MTAKIRVPRDVFEVLQSLDSGGFLDIARREKEKGFLIALTHCKFEFETRKEDRFNRTYDWLKKHKHEFFWGILDGFEIGG
jgi:hypothetical protein